MLSTLSQFVSTIHRPAIRAVTCLVVVTLVGCDDADSPGSQSGGVSGGGTDAVLITGATIWDGTGRAAIPDGALLIRDGRVAAVGPASTVAAPDGATTVDLTGRWITPGLINTHGHVGGVGADEDPLGSVRAELERYARFGITTVNSLGGEPDAAEDLRHVLVTEPTVGRARLFMASDVVVGTTPGEATSMVMANADLGADYIKIRVDDNLGTTEKMTPDVYRAVVEAAHARGLPLAAHLYYLDDAKALLRAGADLIGHSVRDQPVDDELIGLFLETGVCYVPTLMREASTFVYRERPGFMDDPFLTGDVDSAQVRTVEAPEFQERMAGSRSAALYEVALTVAFGNVKSLFDAGVTIAMGTDTGPLGRFQGYFEHHELGMMVEAGLTPEQALLSATRDAAACMGRSDLGTLEEGRLADFVVYAADPLSDVLNTRSIEQVWVGGEQVERGR